MSAFHGLHTEPRPARLGHRTEAHAVTPPRRAAGRAAEQLRPPQRAEGGTAGPFLSGDGAGHPLPARDRHAAGGTRLSPLPWGPTGPRPGLPCSLTSSRANLRRLNSANVGGASPSVSPHVWGADAESEPHTLPRMWDVQPRKPLPQNPPR